MRAARASAQENFILAMRAPQMILRLRCEGILARALIDWPRYIGAYWWAKAASFPDFIESVKSV